MCAAKTHQLKTMMKCAMVAKLSKSDGVPVEVAPGVLLGSIGCVALQENLDAAGVTHILTVANAILPLYATLHAALLACNVTARLLGVPPGLTASTRTRWCLSPTPCPRTYSRSSRTASVSLTRTCSQRVNGKLSSGVPEGYSCWLAQGTRVRRSRTRPLLCREIAVYHHLCWYVPVACGWTPEHVK